jgi:hypothetical protein
LTGAVAILGVASVLFAIFAAGSELLRSVLVGVLVFAVAGVTWQALPRRELAVLAAAMVAAWSLVYQAPWIVLVGALGPAVLCQVTPRNRWASSVLAAAVAGALTWFLASWTLSGGVAGVAFLLAILRPQLPTEQQLAFLRASALFAPGLLLLGLMVANAATGYADDLPVRRIVALVVGLAGLVVFMGLAGLGQSTLMESRDPLQRHVWVSLVAGLAPALGLVGTSDPASVLAALPLAVAPLVLAGAVTVARIDQTTDVPSLVTYCLPLLVILTQVGF